MGLIWVLALAGPAWSAERLTLESLAGEAAFQEVAFTELLGVDERALGFEVPIPSIYRRWVSPMGASGGLMWSRMADYSRIRHGRRQTGLTGLLVAQPSDMIRYVERLGGFRDGRGMDESNLAERLERQGGSRIRVERVDRSGVPMLLVEADLSHREYLRAIYIGTDAGTRKLFYLPQTPWSEADALVWARLRDAVLDGTATASR